ncbi:MAG TPA: DUF111 family protein, partial [Burkholderiaceae bacterium]|nr:DUF111 family protein [Burkholderiaceae bacterium]
GAAIARYLALQPYSDGTGTPVHSSSSLSELLQLQHIGHGFGTRRLPGVANVLRCLVYQPLDTPDRSERRRETIAWMHFEIDDQPAEDLAVAVDRLRALDGVLELYQLPLFGKKGRLATQIQILVEEPRVDAVAEACFRETTPLGLRVLPVQRRFLARRAATVPAAGTGLRVKLAERPAGERTAKAEMDDLARVEGGYAARQRARSAAENQALGQALDETRIETDADLERHGR